MSFWPNDIIVERNNSPRDIMMRAGDELSIRTKVLSVSIRESRLSDRVVLGFIVKNEAYSLEFNLLEASHRPDQSYPVVIEPPPSDIPDFLKRERYIPGSPGLGFTSKALSMVIEGSAGRTVENEWVCATPAEFTEILKKVFALDHVKSTIVSLQAPTAVNEPPTNLSDSTETRPRMSRQKETSDVGAGSGNAQ
ncbi:MAG TPA: hypothetical protein VJY33_08940 [Isosphaeraceae bacterium]|nr:hypothetical protein [Isosphaeraceae bacterium]